MKKAKKVNIIEVDETLYSAFVDAMQQYRKEQYAYETYEELMSKGLMLHMNDDAIIYHNDAFRSAIKRLAMLACMVLEKEDYNEEDEAIWKRVYRTEFIDVPIDEIPEECYDDELGPMVYNPHAYTFMDEFTEDDFEECDALGNKV